VYQRHAIGSHLEGNESAGAERGCSIQIKQIDIFLSDRELVLVYNSTYTGGKPPLYKWAASRIYIYIYIYIYKYIYIAGVLGIALNPNGLTHMCDGHDIVYLQ
jgi:hypothetical protein